MCVGTKWITPHVSGLFSEYVLKRLQVAINVHDATGNRTCALYGVKLLFDIDQVLSNYCNEAL